MEWMIVIGLLVAIAVIGTPIIAFLAYQKANQLEIQIRQLKRELSQLSGEKEPSKPPTSIAELDGDFELACLSPSSENKSFNTPSIQPVTEPETEPTVRSAADEQPHAITNQHNLPSDPISNWLDRTFEHMRDNWLVWIGGLALVVGAGYLVQVVGSSFTFSPMVRVLAATLFSIGVISLGEITHRKISAISTTFLSQNADTYIPAALYAAGMSGLYATVLFSTVVYQFFTPSIALIAMAVLALVCLTLTLRLGPLMAALGLFGGYSAPFWIGGNDPSYILLTCYITTITIAGLLTHTRSKLVWLPLAVTVAHCCWLLLLIFNIPNEIITRWYISTISLSSLLLVFMPYMGISLKLRYRQISKWKYSLPTIPALGLTLVSLAYLEQTLYRESGALWFFLYPVLLLALPMLRGNFALRSYYPVTALALLCIQLGAIAIDDVTTSTLLWIVVAAATVIAVTRSTSQYLLGDRGIVAYWMAVIVLPGMLLINLLYLEVIQSPFIQFWAVFSAISSLFALVIAVRVGQLVKEASSSLHLIALALSYCFLNSEWLALSISLQVVIAVWQHTRKLYSPGTLAIKAMTTALILLVSAIPFVPALQISLIGTWSSVAESYVPAIGALWIARHLLTKHKLGLLAEWLEGSILHLAVVLIFAQTNYWLLGSFNFISDFSFYSTSLFITQAIALFAVYQYKLKHAVKLRIFYQGYCYLLLSIVAVLFFVLNTIYQPLLNSYVTGADLPLINWLAPGWLLPVLATLAISHYRLYTQPMKSLYLNTFAAIAFGLWVTLSIRQFWQQGSMMLDQPTGMAEMFSYSVALILAGAATTYIGVRRTHNLIQKVGLITLGVAICKVFLLDTATLEGIWRAISFLGLGGSLIALGWLFQRLNYRTEQEGKAEVRSEK